MTGAGRKDLYPIYVLIVLTVVYILNFVDRQILSALALDLKRDLAVSDADLGFLYGTAFGVFYALFGVPMGRLADRWQRVRLLTIGLILWSLMTAASAFAQNGGQLAIARIGVGVGEATAAPCAYALLSAYFRPERRATVLAIYSSGLYFGAGLSLFLGGLIVHWWNLTFPDGWHGIVGWRAAFLLVGAPGLLLALLVATLREPPIARPAEPGRTRPLRIFIEEVMIVLPPLTLIAAARRGAAALALNLIVAAAIATVVAGAIRLTTDVAQWCAIGIGAYAVFSWASDLRHRDAPTFALIWRSPAFILLVLAYGLNASIGYAVTFWTLPYAEQSFGLNRAQAGLLIGGLTAMGGFTGAIAGGWLADAARRRWRVGRLIVALISFLAPIPLYFVAFSTRDVMLFYALLFPMSALSSAGFGAIAATTHDLVLPSMRGAATATLYLGLTLLGLAIGPYVAGRVSMWSGQLATGVLSVCALVIPAVIALLIVIRRLAAAEENVARRAEASPV